MEAVSSPAVPAREPRWLRLGALSLSTPASRWLAGITVVALALRLALVFTVQPDPRDGRFDDSVWYYGTARHLADGDGYVFPADIFCANEVLCAAPSGAGGENPPTSLWAPGYPLVLAGLFLLPGDDLAAARGLNVVAGVALVLFVYYLGSRLWSPTAGLAAATIIAAFPSHILFSGLLMTEVLFTTLVAGLLCLALAWTSQLDAPRWRVFALGVAAAAVGLVRPEGIFAALAIVAMWVLAHRSFRRVTLNVALFATGMAVLITPWTVRNIIQLDAPLVGTTGMGQVLIQGHNPDAGGRPDFYAVTRLWNRFDHVPLPEREVRINEAGIRDSIDYAVHHIPRELSLAPHRLAWFFRSDDTVLFWLQNSAEGKPRPMSSAWEDRWSTVANAYYYVVTGLMVLGLPFWLRRVRSEHALVIGVFGVYVAMWALLFVGEARYHFPLLPIFSLLGGAGAVAACERARALLFGDSRPAVPALVEGPAGDV